MIKVSLLPHPQERRSLMRLLPVARPHPVGPLLTRLARRSVGLLSAFAMATGLLLAVTPTASAADSTTDLGMNWSNRPGDIAVGNGKVFVSNGDRIAVTDAKGQLVGAITSLSDAYGLAMAPDGAHLYAALIGPRQVIEIDTASLEITRRIDLAAYPCPTNLARSGDWLWVGYGCLTTWGGGVIGLDLSTPAPQPVAVATDLFGAPVLAAGGNTLAVGERELSPSDMFVYDVSATPTLRGTIDGLTNETSGPIELVVTPDGSNLLSASATPYRFERWDTTTLARVRSYGEEPGSPGLPMGLALSPDGTRVVGGRTHGTDITMYDATTGAKIHEVDNEIGDLVAGSVAFLGTDVFAVLRSSNDDSLHLWRLEGFTRPDSTLTLTAPADPFVNRQLALTGRLELPGEPAPGTQTLTVTRRLPDGTSQPLDNVTTAADGSFTVTDTPTVGGEHVYTAFWGGNGGFRGSTASVTATVKYKPSLTLTGPAGGPVGTTLTFSGVLRFDGLNSTDGFTLKVSRTVSNGNGTITTTLPSAHPSSNGTYRFTDRPREPGIYTYTVEWLGSGLFPPATANHDVRVLTVIE
ncbi:hypothetical protein ACIBHX_00425 [Nonomuraea sp. NPDC050536]|uniref:hypothetical protein n=1 Tax=Nonomuraea sp. NPDC050536 TaxID=3364366 RepID=UPI0037CACF34